jgi:hypothetical protein
VPPPASGNAKVPLTVDAAGRPEGIAGLGTAQVEQKMPQEDKTKPLLEVQNTQKKR